MKKKSYSLKELAELTNCELVGNPDHLIFDVADLETATSEDASFFSNLRYLQTMKKSEAGVIFIDDKSPKAEGKNYLISEQPSKSFQQLIDLLHPINKHRSGFEGIHPTAIVHDSAQIGSGVKMGPHVVVDAGVIIGNQTTLSAGCYIGPNTEIGEYCYFHPGVIVRENCLIGNRVIIQPGAVIGSCGFGYISENGNHKKLNQVGSVKIEDDVEIGANTTIDRARFQSTVIGKGTKIDNLVQIGHGVRIGQHSILVAQTGIAGSTKLGEYVILAGQVAVAGHIELASFVTVAGKSGVSKSLPAGKYGGIPAVKIDEYNRNQVFLRHIEKYVKKIEELEKKVEELSKSK